VSLANLTTGQLEARTLDSLRKLHEIEVRPLSGLTVQGCMEFRIEQENRLRETGCILAEWDRRLPLMTREAREIHAQESPKPAPRNSHGQFTQREGGSR
jgi:hypothetical protein